MNDRLVAVIVGSFFLSPVFGSLYSNTWLVKGNINKTEMEGIAAKHGFIVIDKVGTVIRLNTISKQNKIISTYNTNRFKCFFLFCYSEHVIF